MWIGKNVYHSLYHLLIVFQTVGQKWMEAAYVEKTQHPLLRVILLKFKRRQQKEGDTFMFEEAIRRGS